MSEHLGYVRNASAMTTSTNSQDRRSNNNANGNYPRSHSVETIDELGDTWGSVIQQQHPGSGGLERTHSSSNPAVSPIKRPYSRSLSKEHGRHNNNTSLGSPRPAVGGHGGGGGGGGGLVSKSVSMEAGMMKHHMEQPSSASSHPITTTNLPPHVSNHANLSYSNLSHSNNTTSNPHHNAHQEHYLDKAVALTGHGVGCGVLSTAMYSKIDKLMQENELLTAAEGRWGRYTKSEDEERAHRKRLELEEADRNMRNALDEARAERKQEFERQLREEAERQSRPKDLSNIRLVDLQESRRELEALLIEDEKATKKHQRAGQRRQWIDQAAARGRDIPSFLLEMSSDDSDEDIAGCADFGEYASRKRAKKQAQLAAKDADKFKGLRPPGDEGRRLLVEHRTREAMRKKGDEGNADTTKEKQRSKSDSEDEEDEEDDETRANVNVLYKRMIQSIEERRENQRAEEERKRLLYAAEDYAGRQYAAMRKDLRKNVLAEAFGDDFDEHAVAEVKFIEERPDYAAVISAVSNPVVLLQQYRADANGGVGGGGVDEEVTTPFSIVRSPPIRAGLGGGEGKRLFSPDRPVSPPSPIASYTQQQGFFRPLLEAAAKKYVDVLADPFAFLSAPPTNTYVPTGIGGREMNEDDTMIHSLETGNFRALDSAASTTINSPFYTDLSPTVPSTSGLRSTRRTPLDDDEEDVMASTRESTAIKLLESEPGSTGIKSPSNHTTTGAAGPEKTATIPFATVPLMKGCLLMHNQLADLAKAQGIATVKPLIRRMVWKPSDRAHAIVEGGGGVVEGAHNPTTPSTVELGGGAVAVASPPTSPISSELDVDTAVHRIRRQLLNMEGLESDDEDDDERDVAAIEGDEAEEGVVSDTFSDPQLSLDDMLQFVTLTGLKDWMLKDAEENFVPSLEFYSDEEEDTTNNKGTAALNRSGAESESSSKLDVTGRGGVNEEEPEANDELDEDASEVAAANKRIIARRLSRHRNMAQNSVYGKDYVSKMTSIADLSYVPQTHFLHDMVQDFHKCLIPQAKKFLVSITITRMSVAPTNPRFETSMNRGSIRGDGSVIGGGNLMLAAAAQRRRRHNIGSSYYGTRPKVLSEADQAIADEELMDDLKAYHEHSQQLKLQQAASSAPGSIGSGAGSGGGNKRRRTSLQSVAAAMSGIPRASFSSGQQFFSAVERRLSVKGGGRASTTSTVNDASAMGMDGAALNSQKRDQLVKELIYQREHSYTRREDMLARHEAEQSATLALQRELVRDLKPGARLKAAADGRGSTSPFGTPSPVLNKKATKDELSSTSDSDSDSSRLVFSPSAQHRIGNALKGMDESTSNSINPSFGLGVGQSSAWYRDDAPETGEEDVVEELLGTNTVWETEEVTAKKRAERDTRKKERRRLLLLQELDAAVHLPNELIVALDERRAMRRHRVALGQACAEVASAVIAPLQDSTNATDIATADTSIGDLSNSSHSALLHTLSDSVTGGGSAARGVRSLRLKGSIKSVSVPPPLADVPVSPGRSDSLQTSSNTTPSRGGESDSRGSEMASLPGPIRSTAAMSGVGATASSVFSRSSPIAADSGYVEARDGPITQHDWDYIDGLPSDGDEDGDGGGGEGSPNLSLSSSSARVLLARKRDLLRLLSVEGQEANLALRRNRTLALGLGTLAGSSSSGGVSEATLRRKSFELTGGAGSFIGSDFSRRLPSLKSLVSHASGTTPSANTTPMTTNLNFLSDGNHLLPPLLVSTSNGTSNGGSTTILASQDHSVSSPGGGRRGAALVSFPAVDSKLASETVVHQSSTSSQHRQSSSSVTEVLPAPPSPCDSVDGPITDLHVAHSSSSSTDLVTTTGTTEAVPDITNASTTTTNSIVLPPITIDRSAPEYKASLKRKVQLNQLLIDRMKQRVGKGQQ